MRAGERHGSIQSNMSACCAGKFERSGREHNETPPRSACGPYTQRLLLSDDACRVDGACSHHGCIGLVLPAAAVSGANTAEVNGPMGTFELIQAAAAPAYDTEEQQNIAVYKKALPSVVNITSTAGGVRLLLRAGSATGAGVGVHS